MVVGIYEFYSLFSYGLRRRKSFSDKSIIGDFQEVCSVESQGHSLLEEDEIQMRFSINGSRKAKTGCHATVKAGQNRSMILKACAQILFISIHPQQVRQCRGGQSTFNFAGHFLCVHDEGKVNRQFSSIKYECFSFLLLFCYTDPKLLDVPILIQWF